MPGGYVGKILRVDLTSGGMAEEDLPGDEVLRKYIGCYGLGLRFLYDTLKPGFSASDPENPLMFFTGPLTGLRLPGATNTTLTTKNFDTGFIGRSHTHGIFGIQMKAAGYDGITVVGHSEKPVYLWIHDGSAEIRDAGKIWGKDTHETEDLVKEEIGEPSASVAAIGPAGENLCAGALIENDKHHSFSHSGVGSVMGSKKLKAIALFGKKPIPVVNGDRINELWKEWLERMSLPGQWLPIRIHQGTKRNDKRPELQHRGFAGRNFRINQLVEFGLGFSKQKYTARGCPRCPFGCPYELEVTTGPHKGYVATISGGSEPLEGAGAVLGITEPGTIFYMADQYDRLGVEASMAGCTIAMAIEAYEKGLITTEDTDGLELHWGDAEMAEKLLRKYVSREGFGNILASGVKRAAEMIGGDASCFAVHIKGSSMNLHDWRAAWGTFLGHLVSAGAGWPAPGADFLAEPDMGYKTPSDRFDHRGKPLEVRKTGIIKFMNDCTGLCWFTPWGLPDVLRLTAESISAATGWDYSPQELLDAGERVMQLERAFNVRHGLTPDDDYRVSPRLLEPPDGGPGKGKTLAPYLRGMINEYYRLMGWDEKTGKPWRSTLRRFNLDDVARDIWG